MTAVATTGPRTQQVDGLGECAIFRIHSHRARDKFHRALGFETRGFYSFFRPGEYRAVPILSVPKLKAAGIKGVAQSRWYDDLRRCWS